jgi:hypothetical protein
MRAVVEDQGRPGTPAGHATLRASVRTGRSYLLIEEDGAATVHPGDGVRSQFLRWAVTVAGPDAPPRPHESGRWQETFGLPASRRRFLRTLTALRAATAARPADQPPDSHQ